MMQTRQNPLSPVQNSAAPEGGWTLQGLLGHIDRPSDHITVIAVSKTCSAEEISEAHQRGFTHFGENRVQELLTKQEALKNLDLVWHFIGQLQSNKIKLLAGKVRLIHSIDSLKKYSELLEFCKKKQVVQPCLIQVNISKEASKSGLNLDSATEELKAVRDLAEISAPVLGLMGMASPDSTLAAEEFKLLYKLAQKIRVWQKSGIFEIRELSMGMSGDYLNALEAGSTMLRLGSMIFRRSHGI